MTPQVAAKIADVKSAVNAIPFQIPQVIADISPIGMNFERRGAVPPIMPQLDAIQPEIPSVNPDFPIVPADLSNIASYCSGVLCAD